MTRLGRYGTLLAAMAALIMTTFPLVSGQAASASSSQLLNGDLQGVSCTAKNLCIAVGSYSAGGETRTLAEEWNGSTWTVQNTPILEGATSSALQSVSCAPSWCMAVGPSSVGAIAEVWNGASWSLVSLAATPPAAQVALTGVSCQSATSCVAVGSTAGRALAETWSGASWTATETPPSPGVSSNLIAISCVPVSPAGVWCMAVGSYQQRRTSPSKTLADIWDGTAWTVSPTRSQPGPGPSSLNAVSCLSPTWCVAIGAQPLNVSAMEILGEIWNGSGWQLNGPYKKSQYSSVNGVACTPAPLSCVAVGQDGMIPFGWRFNDRNKWNILSDPYDPPGTSDASLNAVACITSTLCETVGTSTDGTLAERLRVLTWIPQSTDS